MVRVSAALSAEVAPAAVLSVAVEAADAA